jgi:hypothetical protein
MVGLDHGVILTRNVAVYEYVVPCLWVMLNVKVVGHR